MLCGCAVHAAGASFTARKEALRCDDSGVMTVAWSGACQDGLATGPGVVAWTETNGTKIRIEGTLAAGSIAGSAEMTFGPATYSGMFRHFVPHGDGFIKYADGAMYEGALASGKPHGRGVRQSADMSRYEGDWVHGQREGNGKAAFALGGSYDGQWRADRFNGAGTIVYAGSGRTFTGQFEDGHVAGAAPPLEATGSYTFRDAAPPVGSHLPDKVAESSLPGTPWEAMSEGERASVRKQYEALEAGDDPPYPAKGMRPVALLISQVHAAFPYYKGPVRVLVKVGPDGKAESVTTVGKVPAEVIKYVSTALVSTQYRPAVCHGAPCTMVFALAFELE